MFHFESFGMLARRLQPLVRAVSYGTAGAGSYSGSWPQHCSIVRAMQEAVRV